MKKKKTSTITIASGKGGTGKTMIATNLASAVSNQKIPAQYIDCDVEEPNGHLFLKPEITLKQNVHVYVPQIDEELCTACGKCVEFCNFNVFMKAEKNAIVFEELCHCCGGCYIVCPAGAIKRKKITIGQIQIGNSGQLSFAQGKINVGNIRTPEMIKNTKSLIDDNRLTIIDAPPGTSCQAVEAVADTDFVILVSEPTPFGLADLEMATEMTEKMNIPRGVVINKCDIGDDRVVDFCAKKNIEILAQFPYSPQVAEACSNGKLVLDDFPDFAEKFNQLFDYVENSVRGEN